MGMGVEAKMRRIPVQLAGASMALSWSHRHRHSNLDPWSKSWSIAWPFTEIQPTPMISNDQSRSWSLNYGASNDDVLRLGPVPAPSIAIKQTRSQALDLRV